MKIVIPTPCKEKLQDDNFCAKCQHQIKDFSDLNDQDIVQNFEKDKVYCGIFNSNQLNRTILQKTISNVMIFSALGLMISPTNAQEPRTACHGNPEPINKTVESETIQFKLKVKNDVNMLTTKGLLTYRLLINDELIEQNLELGKEYTIKCDIQKDSSITVRLASNQDVVEITKNYLSKKLPKNIELNLSEFQNQNIIMGEIVIQPPLKGKMVVTE